MAKGPDKQIAIEAAKLFLMGVEAELQPIQLPSGTHEYMFQTIRTIAEIHEEDILATPNYQKLFQLVSEYISHSKATMNSDDKEMTSAEKIAAAKVNYAQTYFLQFLKKKAQAEKPPKPESSLKYWE